MRINSPVCLSFSLVGIFHQNHQYDQFFLTVSVLRTEKVTIFVPILPQVVTFSVRNINIYQIRKLREAIFSLFYNIFQPNYPILLILQCSFERW